MLTTQDLVRREVHYCVSALVSTLANGYGTINHAQGNTSMDWLMEQALKLSTPVDDYEEPARDAGWKPFGALVCRDDEELNSVVAMDWRNACQHDNLDPYEREVFEHWIVSDWLADKLAEKGEKVDKDFAGMTVWARTTTGQAIYLDSVIEQITAEINSRD